jgi:hypothetical protein
MSRGAAASFVQSAERSLPISKSTKSAIHVSRDSPGCKRSSYDCIDESWLG